MPDGFTAKMLSFVDYYVMYYMQNGNDPVFKNLADVAIRAGYSPRSAASIASENLNKPEIIALIEEKKKEALAAADISVKDILDCYKYIQNVSAKDLLDENGNEIPLHKLPDHVAKAISSIEYETKFDRDENGEKVPIRVRKVRFWNKNQANDSMAKYKGMFEGKGENAVTVNNNTIIAVQNKSEDLAKKALNVPVDTDNITDNV